MRILNYKDIMNLGISSEQYYDWIDDVLRNRDAYIMPTKTRISMKDSDYFNVMPCALPDKNCVGLKVVNRNEKRRENGGLNLDAQIFQFNSALK